MRSSVSAILSDPAPDNTMSFPDYYQSAADHCRLLVLVAHIGRQLKDRTFSAVQEIVAGVEEVKLTDKSGAGRLVRVRYVDNYPTENNEWGEFQGHRRVLGLVSVGACSSQLELQELCSQHEALKAKYTNTVYDSRCVVFSLPKQGSTSSDSECEENGKDETDSEKNEEGLEEGEKEGPDKPPPWFQPHNFKTRLLQYHGSNYASGLKADIQDFISSLFWVLESKRLESSRDSSERLPLLCAPFERKDFVGLDMDSRNNRKRVLGRLKKHLADVSLQAGLLAEAWNYYQMAADVLRPANDWLWLAAALEGLCAVSVILQEQLEKGQVMGARGLSGDEIVEKYREAVIHYGKYKHAGIIETEASIKAVLILIKQGNHLLAAEFLQNVVFINLQMNDEEKIERFMALSELYKQIGFKRKSAFFQRVAAMRCVAPQNPRHDWATCYKLMLKAVYGYSLDLTATEPPSDGWPALQIQLLQELVGTSRKMGAHAASTRHMTYLLQHMFPCLTQAERQDFSGQLAVLASKTGGNFAPLSLDHDLVLPPVNLYCLPTVTRVTVNALSDLLVPYPVSVTKTSGPFLYTPILNVGGGSARSSFKNKQKTLTWVQGDVAEVTIELHNPLPVELKVANIGLLFDGINFEVFPSTLSLGPESSSYKVNLLGVPKDTGQLRILGYTHTVLGVKSMCQLKDIPCSRESPSVVQVIPALPQVQINCDILVKGVWTPSTGPLTLYSGEKTRCRLTLTNVGKIDVVALDVTSDCSLETGGVPPVIEMNIASVKKSLPLAPGKSLELVLNLTGVNDNVSGVRPEDSVSVGSDSRWSASGPSSYPSRSISNPPHSLPSNTHAGSTHLGSGHLSLVSQNSCGSGQSESVSVTANVKVRVEYSGAETDEWCRRGSHTLTVVQLPSLQLSRWDMLPGDTAIACFLVLDLVNRTSVEMELEYTAKKRILIEAGDMCRVPVPVTKCSFSESLDWEGGVGVADYLKGLVKLQWSLTGEGGVERSGVATLDSIAWTDHMMEMLRRPPLVSRLCVGGEEVMEGGEVEHSAGKVLLVDVILENQLLEPVHDCDLTVRLAQEPEYSSRGSVVRGVCEMGAAGAPGVARKGEVEPGGAITHKTSFLPLVPGQFKLAVTATVRFRDRPHSWRLPAASVNVTI